MRDNQTGHEHGGNPMGRPADALDTPVAPGIGGWDARSDALFPAPRNPPTCRRPGGTGRPGRICLRRQSPPRTPNPPAAAGPRHGPRRTRRTWGRGDGSVPGRTAVRAPEIAYHPPDTSTAWHGEAPWTR
ncbi:hypothetical protein NKH18_33835 [Streptomyces sp. M10(2022)]